MTYARNREYVERVQPLADGDEIAVIPPVSGGDFKVQPEPLDLSAIVAQVARPDAGAIATFIGTTRDHARGRTVTHLEYDAYPEMAELEMERIAQKLKLVYDIHEVAIAHRIGPVPIGEASVIIAVSSAHRGAAMDACRDAIDTLKQTVPVWKKEIFEGGEEWIGREGTDDAQGPDGYACGMTPDPWAPAKPPEQIDPPAPARSGACAGRSSKPRNIFQRDRRRHRRRGARAGQVRLAPHRRPRQGGVPLQLPHRDRRLRAALGLEFGVGFALLLLVHEMGHVIQLRREGVKAQRADVHPVHGRVRGHEGAAEERLHRGQGGSRRAGAGHAGRLRWSSGWASTSTPNCLRALAYFGFFLNLFNLIPVVPLDGGRAVSALHPWLLVRRACSSIAILAFHYGNPSSSSSCLVASRCTSAGAPKRPGDARVQPDPVRAAADHLRRCTWSWSSRWSRHARRPREPLVVGSRMGR